MRSGLNTHGEFQPGNTLMGPVVFHRADLVPVYSFGENELFQQVIFPEGSLGRRLQDLFKKIMGFAPCLFIGERMALVPYKIPITIVGKPAVLPHPLNFGQYLLFVTLNVCFFQWENRSRCRNGPHPRKKKWTTIMNFTWRLCPSCSMNTSSAVDFPKTTNFRSSRFFLTRNINSLFPCRIFKRASTLWVCRQHWMLWRHLPLLYITCTLMSFDSIIWNSSDGESSRIHKNSDQT